MISHWSFHLYLPNNWWFFFLILAILGLCCGAWAFSSLRHGGFLLWHSDFSSCNTRASLPHSMWDLSTHIPCIGRWILNHWTIRKSHNWCFFSIISYTYLPPIRFWLEHLSYYWVEFFIYSGYKSFDQIIVLQIFSPVCGLSIDILNNVFQRVVFHFNEGHFIIFFCLRSVLFVFYWRSLCPPKVTKIFVYFHNFRFTLMSMI